MGTGKGKGSTPGLHPSGIFAAVHAGEMRAAGGVASFDGNVEFRGALTQTVYRMDFRVETRTLDGRDEYKVTPVADNAVFPPAPGCRMRQWIGTDD